MYIKSLSIFESFPSVKEVRKVPFKTGANFIVDSGEADEKGNNLGKTTVLRVIDICLGSQDRKYLYTDEELGIVNSELKSYINDSKIYAELVVQDSLDENIVKERHVLKVDLFTNGKRLIDDERYSLPDYYAELNKIFFHNEFSKPTFRQLLGMFVRVNVKDDNTKFLKFLDPRTTYVQYDNIYSYLFRLGSPELNERLLGLRQTHRTLAANLKQLLTMNNIKSINAIEQRALELAAEVQSVKQNISSIVDVEALKRNESEVSIVRAKYSTLVNQIDAYNFKLERIKDTLRIARSEQKHKIDARVLEELYADIKHEISSITKTFDELVAFNTQLINNKIAFFEKQEHEIGEALLSLESQKDDLFKQYRDVVTLIKNNDMGSYVSLQSRFEELTKERGKLEKIIELNAHLSKQISDVESETTLVEESSKVDPKAKLLQFNKFFTPYSESINDEPYYLYKNSDGFPMGIENTSSSTSTGAKKSSIAAFDLAYQSYAKDAGIAAPNFIIHDVIETMDSKGLRHTIRLSNEIGCQYIAAVLRDKLSNIEGMSPSDIRLSLKKDDRFFKM